MTLGKILKEVNKALEKPMDWNEAELLLQDLHRKLTETKWAIEDEPLRKETERLFIQMVAGNYLKKKEAKKGKK